MIKNIAMVSLKILLIQKRKALENTQYQHQWAKFSHILNALYSTSSCFQRNYKNSEVTLLSTKPQSVRCIYSRSGHREPSVYYCA